MHLKGSCHCQAVKFAVESAQPVPYQRCYCSICRKTGGSGGYMINLGAEASTLQVEGEENTAVYRAMIERDGQRQPSRHQRIFCKLCGSHLWAYNDRWPDHLHPVASAIDTDLPVPPESSHMMVGSKASWVQIVGPESEPRFEEYPNTSLADWHKKRGLVY
jgi:hypothetical protein